MFAEVMLTINRERDSWVWNYWGYSSTRRNLKMSDLKTHFIKRWVIAQEHENSSKDTIEKNKEKISKMYHEMQISYQKKMVNKNAMNPNILIKQLLLWKNITAGMW